MPPDVAAAADSKKGTTIDYFLILTAQIESIAAESQGIGKSFFPSSHIVSPPDCLIPFKCRVTKFSSSTCST